MNSKREESSSQSSRPSHDLEPDEDDKNLQLSNLHENELER
jgi:hypothetical protein